MRKLDPSTDVARFTPLRIPDEDNPPSRIVCERVVVWLDEAGDGRNVRILLLEAGLGGDLDRLVGFWENYHNGFISDMSWYDPEGVRLKFLAE